MIVARMRQVALAAAIVGIVAGWVEDPFVPTDVGKVHVKVLKATGVLLALDFVAR